MKEPIPDGKHAPTLETGKKILTGLFFVAVIVLLVIYARKVNWDDVYKVIVNNNRFVVLTAAALVVVSYLVYGCYDLIGRAYCGHKLAKRQVMLVSFICYAFNLTLSTWVGGVAMRYRLYSRLGLDSATITRIFSLSIATNWLGYILLAGVIFSAGLVPIPGGWFIGETTLRLIGAALLVLVVFYLWACAFSKRRRWKVKGQTLQLPSLRMALFQLPSPAPTGWLWARLSGCCWAGMPVIPWCWAYC